MEVNDFRSTITSGMYASLAKVAIFFVDKMKQKIKDVKAPSKIAEHVSVESPVVEQDKSYVHVVIDTSEKGAPMAGAYEWGKDPYTIIPGAGKKKIMKFAKEKWPQYEPPPPAPDVFAFTQVDHPAIAARPYIQPTIEDNAEEIRKMLAADFKASIVGSMQKVVVIK